MRVTDAQIIRALLETGNIRVAAEKLRISESSIYRRKRQEQFKKKYREITDDLLKDAAGLLQNSMAEAVKTLDEVRKDPKTPPQVRVNAAVAVLSHGRQLKESADLVERVQTLEEVVEHEKY